MRRVLASALAAVVVAGAVAVTQGAVTSNAAGAQPLAAPAAAAETYSWRNVEIAGGGFVPGIIFNRKEADLSYARTDIGPVS